MVVSIEVTAALGRGWGLEMVHLCHLDFELDPGRAGCKLTGCPCTSRQGLRKSV